MKISILSSDLSRNCLGRAYLLAKILQRHYEVEIGGPVFGDGIWGPVANDKDMIYKSIKIYGRFKPYWQIKELAKKINGDIIYASKPLFTSFGVGLLKKLFNSKPVILDIDDWQMGFISEYRKNLSLVNRLKFLSYSILLLYNTSSYWNNLFSEKLTCFTDEITVSNRFLQRKFGGQIIWHARDTGAFDPGKFDKDSLKKRWGIDETKKVVMFYGTPRPHKGIEDLIEAIKLVENSNIILVVVGTDDREQYCRDLVRTAKKVLEKRFEEFGLQPFEKTPQFLAMSDVVIIPQRKNSATIGQVPARVFDAMAMAKPIIATNVSDLSEILDECGWIVEPGSPKQLAEAIQYVFAHPEEAEEKGWKARQRCIDKYSWDVMEKILVGIFRKYE